MKKRQEQIKNSLSVMNIQKAVFFICRLSGDFDCFAARSLLSIHHCGNLQTAALISRNAEAIGEAPIPFFPAVVGVFHTGKGTVGGGGGIHIIVIRPIDRRPGNIGIAVTFRTNPQILGSGRGIDVVFHLTDGDRQALRNLQHLCNGDRKIFPIAVGRGHADELPLAVEQTATAAALRNHCRGGDIIPVEGTDGAGGHCISPPAGRADGGDGFTDAVGLGGSGGLQAFFIDAQNGNIRFRL